MLAAHIKGRVTPAGRALDPPPCGRLRQVVLGLGPGGGIPQAGARPPAAVPGGRSAPVKLTGAALAEVKHLRST